MTHLQVFGRKFTPIRRFLASKTHPFWPHIPGSLVNYEIFESSLQFYESKMKKITFKSIHEIQNHRFDSGPPC